MMRPTGTHWRSIALLLAFALGALLFLGVSLTTGVRSVVALVGGSADAAGEMIKSFAAGFELILLLICARFLLQRTLHQAGADLPFRYPFARWQIPVLSVMFFFGVGLGTLATTSGISWLNWLLLPTLTVLTVLLPIFLFLGIGTRGIPFGARWKAWGTLGIGMTIGPASMITLEILALFLFAVVGLIALAGHPEVIRELVRIGKLLTQNVDEQTVIELLAPYIVQPVTIASLLIYLSLAVPLIEELLKPLAVWLFAKNLNSPTHGFALGMLGGAAFALVESLNVSSDGGSGWAVVVLVRAGTSLLHMTTSGLMGFAIAELFHGNKVGRFLATYLAAVMLHGLWNACAVGAGLASVGELVGRPEWINDLPAALGGISVLSVGIFVVLVAANRKVRSQVPVAQEAAPEEGVK